jgi:hypothetical protein
MGCGLAAWLWSYEPTTPKVENIPDVSRVVELWWRVEAEWEEVPAQMCIDLIKSMPRRVAAVLKAKGGYTKY